MCQMKIKELESRIVDFEPGDGTHYEFIMCNDKCKKEIIAATLNSVELPGSRFNTDSVIDFIKNHRALLTMPKGEYQKFILHSNILNDHYIKYIHEKTKCREYTALALIICMYVYLFDFFKIEEWYKGVVKDG